jgi:predicted dehydrogenase
MKPVKVAIIGVGTIGRKHMEIASASTDCQLVAVCDVDPAQAVTAHEFGVPFYEDYTALLAEQAPQGAIIATPTDQHAAVGMVCAGHGVHVLVEKPIAATVAEAKRFLNVAERYDIQVLVGHHRRHNPLVQRARAIVQRGELGKLVAVSVLWALLKPRDYYNAAWRTQPGGGPVLTNLAHDIDNLRYICGEIRSVYAATSSVTRGFSVEDTASITLQFENGALGSILVSDVVPSPWSYELTSGENPIYPQSGEDCYYFCGTQGSLAFPRMTLWRYPNTQEAGWYHPLEKSRLHVEQADPLAAQLAHFCRVIRNEERPLISGWDGLRTLTTTLAVLESARRDSPVYPAVVITERGGV